MAELDPTETAGVSHKLSPRDELHFPAHLQFNLPSFHLSSPLHLFHLRLRGEALLVGTIHGITHIEEILHHQQCVFRQE